MPFDRKRYPAHWRELVAARLALAEHRCECSGECRSLHLVELTVDRLRGAR